MIANKTVSTVKSNHFSLSNEIKSVKPMSFRGSVVFFGIPSLIMAFSYYIFMPFLQSLGISHYNAFFVAHIIPMSMFIVATFVLLEREGVHTFSEFISRTRFNNFKLRYFVYGIGVFFALNFAYGPFDAIATVLIESNIITIPDFVPLFGDPRIEITPGFLLSIVGEQLAGNWGIILIFLMSLFFNIVGEELFWRGYVLPRQEVRFGKHTWIVHGLMWTFFHSFKYWDLLGLLPVCLIISYVAQRKQNNWISFIAHLLFNGILIVFLLPVVLA